MPTEDDDTTARAAITKTVEEAQLLADQRREAGWNALVVPAVESTAISSDSDADSDADMDADSGRWGFVHVVPADLTEQVTAACTGGTFPQYDVYRRKIGETVCFVTELLDPETATVLLVAGRYTTSDAAALYREATREGLVRTHLQDLDGEALATFEHEDVTKFFPEGMASPDGQQ